jgi:uncharacterized spore protein YtfJ
MSKHDNGPAKSLSTVEGVLERFLATASVERVFGEPVRHESTVILPAAENVVLVGFGAGSGSGQGGEEEGSGGGEGGGGGGSIHTRPVAVIVADASGVHVEPVIDATKIAVTAITAWGLMIAAMGGTLGPKALLRRLRRRR